MHHAAIASAFEGTVLLSTAAALGIAAERAWAARSSRQRPEPSRGASRGAIGTLFLHPLAQFFLVCAIVYVNQVLFGAFILRAHGGSTTFIAQYIPGDWFAIGRHDPLVALAARHVGDGQWLSPTLLRVQAFLELPFTMFAYLAVARLLGREVYATLCKPAILALAAVSFSVTFSLVELSLPNPYTTDDLLLRAIACFVVPVYIAWIARREARTVPASSLAAAGPSGVLGLLAFLAGAGAVSYVVLALYDAFLLYNLAHLPRYASGIALSIPIATFASFAAPRVDAAVWRSRASASPAIDVCVSALRTFTVLFFVPSLSLRYWGAHSTAAACGVLVVVLASVGGAVTALGRSRAGLAGVVRLGLGGGVALALGAWAALLVLGTAGHGTMPELLLARLALSFLAVAITSFRAVEIALCWPSHETKAEADQA